MTLHTHPARLTLRFASLAFTFRTPEHVVARCSTDTHPNIDLQNANITFVKHASFIWKHPYIFNPVKLLACS